MTVSFRVILGSCAFSLGAALVYAFTTHEVTGSILLGLLALAFALVAGYLLAARKRTHVDGDDERYTPVQLAGEQIGVVSSESPWPVLLAACTALLLVGAVLHPMLGIAALVGFFAVTWQLIRESV